MLSRLTNKQREPERKTIRITRTGKADLLFIGKLIASAASDPRWNKPHFSGDAGRWSECRLYMTDKGTYIAAEAERTKRRDEIDRFDAEVCKNQKDIVEFFGFSDTAKRLYKAADLNVECQWVE